MCPKMLANGFIKFPDIINYRGACQQVLGLIISLKAITKFIVIGIISNMNMEIVTFPHANMWETCLIEWNYTDNYPLHI